jgi:3-oxoacyl-[acyl-carrier protein] reductase
LHMLMRPIEGIRSPAHYSEIAGKRILVTRITRTYGVDIARALADQQARLVLQFDDTAEEMQAVAELVSTSALDVKLFAGAVAGTNAVVRFARAAVTAFGGLDAVVNLVPLAGERVPPDVSVSELEQIASSRLLLTCLVSNIAANRMRLLHTKGLILNIATITQDASARDRAFAGVIKTALSAMTRSQAEEWAGEGIRFNAIAAPVASGGQTSMVAETDIAELALRLISGCGRTLSGHVLEAESAR